MTSLRSMLDLVKLLKLESMITLASYKTEIYLPISLIKPRT